jgi:Asp/Glu/hydantoin racemase
MTTSRHIGIVAVSAEGAALCCRTICVEGSALFGLHGHPERINAVIFDELVQGQFKSESRRYYQTVIERFATAGCDAVVLGCTEIPLLVADADSPLPVIDATRTLARAALRQSSLIGSAAGSLTATS